MGFVLSSHSIVRDLVRDYSIEFVSSMNSSRAAQLSMNTISLGLKVPPAFICVWSMYVVYVYGGVCTRLCACRGQRRILCVLLHHALPYSLEIVNLELTITQQACGCSPQHWGGRKMLSHTQLSVWMLGV